MGTKAQVLSSTETPEPHGASTSSSVKWVPCWPAHTQGRGEGGLKSHMEGLCPGTTVTLAHLRSVLKEQIPMSRVPTLGSCKHLSTVGEAPALGLKA